MEVKLNALRAGCKDLTERACETVRAVAYGAGFRAGENAAAVRADLLRREMAVVLVALGDAIAAGERTDMIAWYGALPRVFACDVDE